MFFSPCVCCGCTYVAVRGWLWCGMYDARVRLRALRERAEDGIWFISPISFEYSLHYMAVFEMMNMRTLVFVIICLRARSLSVCVCIVTILCGCKYGYMVYMDVCMLALLGCADVFVAARLEQVEWVVIKIEMMDGARAFGADGRVYVEVFCSHYPFFCSLFTTKWSYGKMRVRDLRLIDI